MDVHSSVDEVHELATSNPHPIKHRTKGNSRKTMIFTISSFKQPNTEKISSAILEKIDEVPVEKPKHPKINEFNIELAKQRNPIFPPKKEKARIFHFMRPVRQFISKELNDLSNPGIVFGYMPMSFSPPIKPVIPDFKDVEGSILDTKQVEKLNKILEENDNKLLK